MKTDTMKTRQEMMIRERRGKLLGTIGMTIALVVIIATVVAATG